MPHYIHWYSEKQRQKTTRRTKESHQAVYRGLPRALPREDAEYCLMAEWGGERTSSPQFQHKTAKPYYTSRLSRELYLPVPTPSPPRACPLFLFCSCVCFCLYGPFNCISFYKFSRQLSAFSLCSSGFISALLVLSTVYLFKKVSLGPDIVLCGWLGLKHQLSLSPQKSRTKVTWGRFSWKQSNNDDTIVSTRQDTFNMLNHRL